MEKIRTHKCPTKITKDIDMAISLVIFVGAMHTFNNMMQTFTRQIVM
jgi:hypothetical protein